MSVGARVNQRLAALTAAGTSVWLDQIRRSLIESGELERLVREDSLRGVTSNPAIFEKAILGSSDYDEQIERAGREGLDARRDLRADRDHRRRAGLRRPARRVGRGRRGGRLRVARGRARLRARHGATLAQARDFWGRVDRPNLMIKIPGTEEGVPAIEQAISEGINVNVTLLFSVESYTAIAEAYIRGMERRLDAGESLDVHSVASFFVSRVDTEVDKRLEGGGPRTCGAAPLANARAAYRSSRSSSWASASPRFARPAPVQRPLWASTGVKDPHYPETKYVDSWSRRTRSTRCRCRRCWPARSGSR